ncbi:hypothetical protein L3Y34_012032 [Caenorhabditis briggsae]|uniref:RING-type E3 ubiquitin transferase n=3 Tax=Caenorhabditis briggsae TaxID=6238 RepID=A0AAE9CVA3_CAEBR|nr:hypothetical protein L3Y34_012032 [Caenorhabditis briggsae]
MVRLECKICLREYKTNIAKLTPRILTKCGHTLCESCCEILSNQNETKDLICPFDRKMTKINQNMQELMKNFAITEYLDELNQAVQRGTNQLALTVFSFNNFFKTFSFKMARLECKICTLEYKTNIAKLTPRILTKCGHTLCESCCEILSNQNETKDLICPFDRKMTKINRNVQELMKNFAITEYIDELSQTGQQDAEHIEQDLRLPVRNRAESEDTEEHNIIQQLYNLQLREQQNERNIRELQRERRPETLINQIPARFMRHYYDSGLDSIEGNHQQLVDVLARMARLECKICTLEYKTNIAKLTPRILTKCGHTLCESCCEILSNQNETKDLICPFDRKMTKINQNVQELMKNFAITEYLDELNQAVQRGTNQTEQDFRLPHVNRAESEDPEENHFIEQLYNVLVREDEENNRDFELELDRPVTPDDEIPVGYMHNVYVSDSDSEDENYRQMVNDLARFNIGDYGDNYEDFDEIFIQDE